MAPAASWTVVRSKTSKALGASYLLGQADDDKVAAKEELRGLIVGLRTARRRGDSRIECARLRAQVAFCRMKVDGLRVRVRAAREHRAARLVSLRRYATRFCARGKEVTCIASEDVAAIRCIRDFRGMRLLFRIGTSIKGPAALYIRSELHELSDGVIPDVETEDHFELTPAGVFRVVD